MHNQPQLLLFAIMIPTQPTLIATNFTRNRVAIHIYTHSQLHPADAVIYHPCSPPHHAITGWHCCPCTLPCACHILVPHTQMQRLQHAGRLGYTPAQPCAWPWPACPTTCQESGSPKAANKWQWLDQICVLSEQLAYTKHGNIPSHGMQLELTGQRMLATLTCAYQHA